MSTVCHQGAHKQCFLNQHQQTREKKQNNLDSSLRQLGRQAHLNVLHAQDVPAVVHVLLKVFVLEKRAPPLEQSGEVRSSWTATVGKLTTSPRLSIRSWITNVKKCINFSIRDARKARVESKVTAKVKAASPGIRRPGWATCLCGRCRAKWRCWRVSGPSVETLRR